MRRQAVLPIERDGAKSRRPVERERGQLAHAGFENEPADAQPAGLVFEDLDLILRATRDYFTEDIDRIVCDSEPDFARIAAFVRSLRIAMPASTSS